MILIQINTTKNIAEARNLAKKVINKSKLLKQDDLLLFEHKSKLLKQDDLLLFEHLIYCSAMPYRHICKILSRYLMDSRDTLSIII